jgi:hypothetical protein
MRHVAPPRVRQYYRDCVDQAVAELGVPRDPAIAAYLGDVLTRYAFRIDVQADSITALLASIQECWRLDGGAFDPGREIGLRREVGDAVLFLTGFLWERVVSRRVRRQLVRAGRGAYRFLAEYHRAAGRPAASSVFGTLARRFARYSVLLMHVREVYLDIARERPLGTAGPR